MECIPKSSNQNTAIQRSNHIIDVCKNKVQIIFPKKYETNFLESV